MCGIAGFIDTKRETTSDRLQDIVLSMTERLRHRGPDNGGVWVNSHAGIALGHRRLSILDLSPMGHQPMHSPCGRYCIVFNGEIYNFRRLRKELEELGCSFTGHSDTEVMLAAIVQWGLDGALQRLNGMFAFALWDRQTGTLSLARDRMGEKPLYYGWAGPIFLFGSELKALCQHPSFNHSIHRGALALYLRYGYIPGSLSIYAGVRKLPPGCVLSLKQAAVGTLQLPKAYWSVTKVAEAGISDPFKGNEQEAADELEELLADAVRLRLEADVPIGAFLSGGVDSSTVVALMQSAMTRSARTFTIGFKEDSYNEAEYSKRVAGHLGTDHTELYVTPTEASNVIPQLPILYDEPFSDPSQIPTFLVSKLARRSVTVALSGDGGDELFGGYARYGRGQRAWALKGRVPPLLRAPAANLLHLGSHWLPATLADRVTRFSALLRASFPDEFYLEMSSEWPDADQTVWGAANSLQMLQNELPASNMHDFTLRMMRLDAISYLPDDILVKLDRASMGVSLESRVPLLDHRIVEFAWRLPLQFKRTRQSTKAVLRQVLYRYVPKHLIERPKKGFSIPIGQWLRGPLKPWAEALLLKKRLRSEGYLDATRVRTAWLRHLSGIETYTSVIWRILVLEAWLDRTHYHDYLLDSNNRKCWATRAADICSLSNCPPQQQTAPSA